VYRDVDDGNDVTAWHDFNNLEAAKAFANSTELKAAMKGAGVIGGTHRLDYPPHLIEAPRKEHGYDNSGCCARSRRYENVAKRRR
jgi:hypothetical protein